MTEVKTKALRIGAGSPAVVVPETGPEIVNKRRRKPITFDKVSFFVVFLGLPLAMYILFVISPFAQAFYYSMTDWSGFSPTMNFTGFENYRRILTDDIFMKAMGNNILLVICLPIITIILSLILATLVTVGGSSKGQIKGLRNSSFYRVVSFFPYTIPAIAIGIMWGQIYDPSNGLLNGILTSLGLEQFKSFPWLGDKSTAMIATMFVIVWGFVGFYMVLFVAGIKGIPAELFEAARIDGAGRFRTAVSITIPLIRDNIQTAYIYMGILALDAFVYMAALNSGGGPDNSTLVMSQQLFFTAFSKGQFGLASAMGVVLAITTLIFSGLVFLVNRLTGGEKDVSL
ncbi:carbohydrate ABC transporter permease [bacterium RCC_150]